MIKCLQTTANNNKKEKIEGDHTISSTRLTTVSLVLHRK